MTEKIIIILGVLTLTLLLCTITGTLIWLLWDNTIPYIFEGLVSNGYIERNPEWFDVVKFSWIVGLLFSPISGKKDNN